MTINNNLMNPVPLWTSKNDWYCKKATNHGNCVRPVVPKGTLPAMQLTIGGRLPTETKEMIMSYNNRSVIREVVVPVTGNVIASFDANTTVKISPHSAKYADIYDVVLQTPLLEYTMHKVGDDLAYVTKETLANYEELTDVETGTVSLQIRIDMTVHAKMEYQLYKLDGTFTGAGVMELEDIIEIPSILRTSDRYAAIYVPERGVEGVFDDGVYYLKVIGADIADMYSEPFMWLSDLSQHLFVTYRRSEPIITTDNYITFNVGGVARSMHMYIPGRLLMPPFVFNDEVDEIDGRKYSRKQVSYKDEKCEFMCTAYFAEAIRLLWHCDIRYAGNMRVEYMVRPEIDWNTDNHLCNVTLEFQGDTVMQTNGTASAYGDSSDSDHQAYDASFDASFQ